MILNKIISYKENNPTAWELSSFELQNVNLIVGLNATGKSRILRLINGLAEILYKSQQVPYANGYYNVEFIAEDEKVYSYEILFSNSIIQNELLLINGSEILKRDSSGSGRLYSEAIKDFINIKIPVSQVAATRRDTLHFTYLEELYNWANSIRYFRFTQESSKNLFGVIDSNRTNQDDFDLKETDKTVRAFNRGHLKFNRQFIDNVISDFNTIGYNVSEVFLAPLNSIKAENNQKVVWQGIHVKEIDLDSSTDQQDMSDGMFRALSIIIHVNLYELENIPYCLLIDDIGEGLDFWRATGLIKLLISKSTRKTQLIFTTNDKFIMNNTSLDYWNVIRRDRHSVSLINKKNSPEIFDNFQYTGLNNFDFFSTGFYSEGLKAE